ncbi:MAG: DNA cytosine methyltransferase [Flavobacterium sp.]|jgi:DNA (cytosine-5)-methyltransferase 1|nr:DNA cytosine methyltransferase [Flavobacterium sp.]
MAQLKFIDLFAGLGGFHLALQELGHKCVYACELNEELRTIYKKNFPETQNIGSDITAISIEEIPTFDIFCVDFPFYKYQFLF